MGTEPSPGMLRRYGRNLIRVLVGAALCVAVVAAASAPIPEDLPAVAMQQPGVYRLEVALLTFYCCLLLVTPAFSGLIQGRLPIEISTRGARFVEEADQSANLNERRIENLERATDDLTAGLRIAKSEINQMKQGSERDNTQPAVISKND